MISLIKPYLYTSLLKPVFRAGWLASTQMTGRCFGMSVSAGRLTARLTIIQTFMFHLHVSLLLVGVQRDGDQKSDYIHCVGINPVCLYTLKPSDTTVSCIDLYDAFPTSRHRYQPSIRIASMGASVYDTVLLHEQVVSSSYI